MEYLRLRKGVADMHRRAEVGAKINDRYAEALATVEEAKPLGELTSTLGRPTKWKGRPVRALNPLSPGDGELLEAVNRGEHMVNGFRNRDLRALLFPKAILLAELEAAGPLPRRRALKRERLPRGRPKTRPGATA